MGHTNQPGIIEDNIIRQPDQTDKEKSTTITNVSFLSFPRWVPPQAKTVDGDR
jgi:hypothetical protein